MRRYNCTCSITTIVIDTGTSGINQDDRESIEMDKRRGHPFRCSYISNRTIKI